MIGYADDCTLLSPSRDGLQSMVILCENYFASHGIAISVSANPLKSKTKCMVFNPLSDPVCICVNNIQLPWVNQAKHLGHLLNGDESSDHDILFRRAEFISKERALRQEIGDQDPNVYMLLVRSYLCAMYGSCLWNLFSAAADKLYKSFNVLIRNNYGLPYATHRYICYEICNIPHLRISLFKRFIKFYLRVEKCPKPEIQNLFLLQKSDVRSTFGHNAINICNELNAQSINDIRISSIVMPGAITAENEWLLPFLFDLLELRKHNTNLIPMTDVNDMIFYTACS